MTRECQMRFDMHTSDGSARRGRLHFPRGTVETPAFMPVGTYGTVKGMLPRDLREIGAELAAATPPGCGGGSPSRRRRRSRGMHAPSIYFIFT